MKTQPAITALPDPLIFANGQPVLTPEDWRARRAELLELILQIEYGPLPPAPTGVWGKYLHEFKNVDTDDFLGRHYRVTVEPSGFSFLATVFVPAAEGPFPVVINGDGCWRYLTNEIVSQMVRRGYALAIFNRVEIVPDNYTWERDAGLYQHYPELNFRALAAWAWGYHRMVDFLATLPRIDMARIVATGHSRGGKAALLAGATDERIALTAPNNSGSGGAGCFRFPDEGGERIKDSYPVTAYWYSDLLYSYIGREDELPFDQHSLKALVAPRALLSTEARGDFAASPRGTRLTYEAAREVYRFLDAEDQIGICYREGGHEHGPADWDAMLDFADNRLFGKQTGRDFDMLP